MRWGSALSYSQVPTETELQSTRSPESALPPRESHSATDRRETWTQRHFRGWRFGILSGSLLAVVVFATNLTVTLLASLRQHRRTGDRKILFEGDCTKTRNLNTGSHLIINVLSTLLLSASNYGMQCLSSPTRSEVDEAHAKRYWLDIGILSIRNTSKISKKRVRLWLLLAASSLPLHLFYNSAVFSSIFTRDYIIFSAREDMLNQTAQSTSLGVGTSDPLYPLATYMYSSALAKNLTRLEPAECIRNQATTFQTGRGSLILVSEDPATPRGPFSYNTTFQTLTQNGCPPEPFAWICGDGQGPTCVVDLKFDQCSTKIASIDPKEWKPFGKTVSYCLSEPIEQQCRLEFSPQIAGVVIVFNFAKVLILVYAYFFLNEDPLMTMGDAVASFLKKSDETTKNFCLMGKDNVGLWKKSVPGSGQGPEPWPFATTRQKWSSVISSGRWALCMALYGIILLICISLFLYGIIGRYDSTHTLMNLGFAAVDPRSFIYGFTPSSGTSGLLSNVFLANLPQAILSTIYYVYNGIFTCFMLGTEWNGYMSERKGLRVSGTPRGAQRSSYFLQLPYRWAVPLMILSGTLHWLCSQSIFLVSIQFDHRALNGTITSGPPRSGDSNVGINEYFTCGYSPPAILAVIFTGFFMVSVLVFMGKRKFKNGGMPVSGSCSASISACCHPPKDENALENESMAYMPVQWGVTDSLFTNEQPGRVVVGHCAFSSRIVSVPEQDAWYAGVGKS